MSSNTPNPTIIQRGGPLYDLFKEYFPDHRTKQGVLDIPGLAKDMDFSHETIYRCVRKNVVKVPVALAILKFSHENHPEQPLFWEDLAPYVLPDFEEYSRAA